MDSWYKSSVAIAYVCDLLTAAWPRQYAIFCDLITRIFQEKCALSSCTSHGKVLYFSAVILCLLHDATPVMTRATLKHVPGIALRLPGPRRHALPRQVACRAARALLPEATKRAWHEDSSAGAHMMFFEE